MKVMGANGSNGPSAEFECWGRVSVGLAYTLCAVSM